MQHTPPSRHLFALVILTPLERLSEVPPYGRALGALAAALSLVSSDVLTGILCLLIAANGCDYFLGRAVAWRNDTYDSRRAQDGALTKLAEIVMLCLVRGFEWWAAVQEIPGIGQTRGGIASAMAVGLFVVQLESIEGHRVALKARPIPGFSQLVALLRAAEQRLAPSLGAPPTPAVEKAE